MEDLENEQDKIGYWLVFFVIVIVIAVVGYFFVFYSDNKVKKETKEEVVEEEDKLDKYIGIWAIFTDDKDIPDSELCINIIDGSTITFDYYVKDSLYFESKTAHVEKDTASFEIENDDEITLEGKMVFRNDKIFLILDASSDEELPLGTFEFSEKTDESLLRPQVGE